MIANAFHAIRRRLPVARGTLAALGVILLLALVGAPAAQAVSMPGSSSDPGKTRVTDAHLVPANPRTSTVSLWEPLILTLDLTMPAGTTKATVATPPELNLVGQDFSIPASSESVSGDAVSVAASPKRLVLSRGEAAQSWQGEIKLTVWLDPDHVVAGKTTHIAFGAGGAAVDLSVPVAAATPVDRHHAVASGSWAAPALQDRLGTSGALSWNVQSAQGSGRFETSVRPGAGQRIDCADVHVRQGQPTGPYAALQRPQPLPASSTQVSCSSGRLQVTAYPTNASAVAEVAFTTTPTKRQDRYRITGTASNGAVVGQPVTAYVDRYEVVGTGASLGVQDGAAGSTTSGVSVFTHAVAPWDWRAAVGLSIPVLALVAGQVWVARGRRSRLA